MNASGNSPRRGRRGWTSGSEGTATMEPIIIEKSPLEQLRIQRREYRGHEFIDVRIYYQNDASEWCPTRKGVTIALDLLDEFKAAIAGRAVDEPPARRHGARS